ncbi:MAG TPA: hypothetical protein VJR89_24275, partial [Polyangiales bacterium]|nr:hypothetical protein [Polyangiales bacterium]
AYGGDKPSASWLPSEALANVWRGFVTKQPLTLAAPENTSELDANQALALRASGLAPGERASFLDGARRLGEPLVADGGGHASASWQPQWGGARAVLAAALSGETIRRLSRPATVLLYGKAPPPDPREPEPSVDPADAGPGDADSDAGQTARREDRGGCSALVSTRCALPSKLAWVLFALVLRRRFARQH